MLALYYRWALQSLSALSYFHSRSVYPTFFSATNVWLRPDYSIAITGFISVEGPELDADSRRHAWKEARRRERRERDFEAWAAGRSREPEASEGSEDESEDIPEDFHGGWDICEWVGDGGSLDYPTEFSKTWGSHRQSLLVPIHLALVNTCISSLANYMIATQILLGDFCLGIDDQHPHGRSTLETGHRLGSVLLA
jgi:hypothetical protein